MTLPTPVPLQAGHLSSDLDSLPLITASYRVICAPPNRYRVGSFTTVGAHDENKAFNDCDEQSFHNAPLAAVQSVL